MKLKFLSCCAAALLTSGVALAEHHEKHAPEVVYSPSKPISTAVVQTPKGVLVGEDMGDVNVFRGVPFAKPPVGDLRWKAPEPVDAWEGHKTVVEYGAPCMQPKLSDPSEPNGGGVQGVKSEDCLYLQVYAPKKAEKAPVVLWMHGGAAYLGAGHLGSYVGMENARKGVITVPMNYRLGALGYFVHPSISAEEGPTGSYAEMDAVAALEWIHENIDSFGGDPDNVTIAGQSAGGYMVMNLLSTPSAKGLFHKAVVQSGAGLTDGRTLAEGEALAVRGLANLGLPDDASAAQLRRVSAQTLVYDPAFRAGITGVVDGEFHPTTTKALMEAGTEIDVPVLVGSNGGERGFDRAKLVAEMAGDTGAGAFLYHFDYLPEFRKAAWTKGPIHSAELMFTFDSLDTSGWGLGQTDEADAAYADIVSSCWVDFYRMDAASKTISCENGFEWPAYSTANDAVAVFDDEVVVGKASALPDGPSAD